MKTDFQYDPKAPFRHPVNRLLREKESTRGARIADRVTDFMGSWTFILIQTVIVSLWVAGNVYLLFDFDPFPFVLLNLAFSTQSAYAAPLILLAGNRTSKRDRITLEHAAAEADIEEEQNKEILEQNRRLLEGNEAILKRVAAMEEAILVISQKILSDVERPRVG